MNQDDRILENKLSLPVSFQLRRKLEEKLEMEPKTLDYRKEEIKALFLSRVNQGEKRKKHQSENDDSSRTKRPKKTAMEKKLQALTRMIKASNVGPRIYAGLPESGVEIVHAMSKALKASGK